MGKFLTNFLFFKKQKQNNPNIKVLITLIILFLFRFGSAIPLSGLDQEALKKAFLELDTKNSFLQLINMYSGGGGISLLSPFSLGILPYINASILIDLLTAIVPFLEKLQSEEGEAGRQQLTFYKKILTLSLAIFQSYLLINSLKPYFYQTTFFSFFLTGVELVTGALLLVWLTSVIDNKGIGNGTSLIIFTNIIVTLLNKNLFSFLIPTPEVFFEIFCLLVLIFFICICQTTRVYVEVISARQLAYLEKNEINSLKETMKSDVEINKNGLSIRLNQAGIFPIIIASNLFPFFSFFTESIGGQFKFITIIIYYLLIIGFNYFYTTVFWDPQKISEQLRKASVSLVNVTPGKETADYLEKMVQSSSLLGGFALCAILIGYEIFKFLFKGPLLNQINISSLIILIGVAYDIQKNLSLLYKIRMKKEKLT